MVEVKQWKLLLFTKGLFCKHLKRVSICANFSERVLVCIEDMSVSLTPSKRQHDGNLTDPDGKGKLQKSQKQPSKNSSGSDVFRVLCPASKIDSLIGENGSVLSQIREETGAELRVEEAIPGCEERVFIIGFDKEDGVHTEQSKKENGKEANVDEKHDETKEQPGDTEDKGSVSVENSKLGKGISSLHRALLLLFDRMVEQHPETDGGDEENKKSSPFVLRLLVLSTQVGCILGKGGNVIKQMSSESGAQIRILPRDKLPPCASALDELVQVKKKNLLNSPYSEISCELMYLIVSHDVGIWLSIFSNGFSTLLTQVYIILSLLSARSTRL